MIALIMASTAGTAAIYGSGVTNDTFAAEIRLPTPLRSPAKKKTVRPREPKVPPREQSPIPISQNKPKGSGDPMPVASNGSGAAGTFAAQSLGASGMKSAVPGASVPGLPGAVWADENSDGTVDGFVYNGQFYAGVPGRAIGGALAGNTNSGAALGAAAGAVVTGVRIPTGAILGAAVGGLPGAVWADRNNDGVVDGYVYNGQYYAGAPTIMPTISRGPERG